MLAETTLRTFSVTCTFCIVGFCAIAMVQARVAPGIARNVMLLAAILTWNSLWTAAAFLGPSEMYVAQEIGIASLSHANAVDHFWSGTTYLLVAAWYYESSERTARATAALGESELARRGAERWLLELRLSALQARLDPQLLFDALDEAQRLYRCRPAAAAQLLDTLTQYLRLSLPRLQHSESTLERETTVAVAYVRLLDSVMGVPLEFDVRLEPRISDASFPPMVLQPLCDALARAALVGGKPAAIRVSATLEGEVARMNITARPVRTPPAYERLAEIQRTLSAMFAPLHRLEITMIPTGVASILVEVPYVASPRADR
jgi:hypothetical protein